MMLLSKLKALDEISSELHSSRSVLVLACNGCEESFGNAEPRRLKYLEAELEKRSIPVASTLTIDFCCEPILVKHWLGVFEGKHKGDIDAILVVSCGIGVQVVSKVISTGSKLPIYPACDTVTMGGRFGQAWGKETCRECGDCILPYTAGICPLTACSKGLLNGPCGGSKDGRCEVFPESRECGWHLIYERLETTGRKHLLLGAPLVKKHSKSEPPEALILLRNEILEKENETL